MTGSDINGHMARGLALHRAGKLHEAEAEYLAALKRDKKNGDAYNLLGLIAQSKGRLEAALIHFDQAIQSTPRAASAHFNKANLLHAVGREDDAIRSYRDAIKHRQDYADARLNLGVLFYKSGDLKEAIKTFREMVLFCPGDARGHFNLGRCLADIKDTPASQLALEKALSLEPNFVDALVALATVYAEAGRMSDAIATLRRALVLQPQKSELHATLGNWLSQFGAQDAAIESYKAACALEPARPEFLFNLGTALYNFGHLDQAEAVLRKTIDVAPSYTNAYVNLGQVLVDANRVDEAIAFFDLALATSPTNEIAADNKGAALGNKGLSLLARGDYQAGWSFYRHRFDHTSKAEGRRFYDMPTWRGEDLSSKTILLWTDQGLGDEIIYSSMVADIMRIAGKCVLECTDRLVPLFQRSFPQATVLPRVTPPDQKILEGAFDFQSSVADLGEFFRPNSISFPSHRGYLCVDQIRAAELRAAYAARAGRNPIIGVSWKSESPVTGVFKTMPLANWLPLLQQTDAFFVSLQYGKPDADLLKLHEQTGIDIYQDPQIDQMNDLDQFAAQVASMDLVISISNTTVHFAGALNVPVWVMVPTGRGALWYFRNGANTPWYPSVRIFRQSRVLDWSDVAAHVASEFIDWRTDFGKVSQ